MNRWRLAVWAAALLAVLGAHVALAGVPVRSRSAGNAADLTQYVRPRAGSLSAGFPFVGAAVPFGMATPGPATMLPTGADPVNYIGYAYQDPLIAGFALTHFDGAGTPIGGDFPIMPTTGAVTSSDPVNFASPYSHATETARPGYYAVSLARYDVRAELTATTRVALLRFHYPAGQQANLLVDSSQNNDGLNLSDVSIVGNHTMTGWMRSARAPGPVIYFHAIFDHAFAAVGTWNGAALQPGSRSSRSTATGAWVSFTAASKAQTITMRVALSYSNATGAAINLRAEAPPSRSFGAIQQAAHDTWNRLLHTIVVTGRDTAALETFYTSLYRALLMPTVMDDADGDYLGFDGHMHRLATGHHHYTNLSLWDIYRSQMPLLELIEPSIARDVATSLLADYQQNNQVFPRWVYANVDYGFMGGNSATPILASDLANGVVSGAAARAAYTAMVHAALTPLATTGHLGVYLTKGYLPYDGANNEPTSESLSYAIDDAAIASVATRYGTPEQVRLFTKLGGYWRHLFDPADRFLRPRNANGSWADPTGVGPASTFTPDSQDGWQEGTGWQYLWSVPQDVSGLAAAIGGRAVTLARLDRFFSTALQTNTAPVPFAQAYASGGGIYYAGNQYTAANEPDLWSPFYYDWLGQPWKTAKVVHAEMRTFNASPDGMPGNDDAGEMSAWYVLSALGIYQVTPGVAAWELSTPTFAKEVIQLGSGAPFVITAPGASWADQYVRAARVDGRVLDRTWISTDQLRPGGALAFETGATPNRSWASSPAAAPPSLQ